MHAYSTIVDVVAGIGATPPPCGWRFFHRLKGVLPSLAFSFFLVMGSTVPYDANTCQRMPYQAMVADMTTDETPRDLIPLTEAIEKAGVHVRTVYRWRDKGDLQTYLRRIESARGMRNVTHVSQAAFDALLAELNEVRPGAGPEGS